MTTDYEFYYWPLPFRGQLVRWVLTYVGASWREFDAEEIVARKGASPFAQDEPFMAPPLLHDAAGDLWLAQLPAILVYLGERHKMLPVSHAARARVVKNICDANDVLDTITRNGGAQMWDEDSWRDQGLPRLIRWMEIFEAALPQSGRSGPPGLGELVSAALWHTMLDRLPPLQKTMYQHAPRVMAETARIAALPELQAFDTEEKSRLGDVYCGGQIEASLRTVLGMIPPADAAFEHAKD